MADFTRKRNITSLKPALKVEGTLPVGRYIFQLVVEDQSGNKSMPVRVQVEIVRSGGGLLGGNGGIILDPPGGNGPIFDPPFRPRG